MTLTRVSDLFEDFFEISADSWKRSPGLPAAGFWNEIYESREAEGRLTSRLCDPTKPLTLVTGHVGCGKTTIILQRMMVPKNASESLAPACCGIRINLESYAEEIKNQTGRLQEQFDQPNANSQKKFVSEISNQVSGTLNHRIAKDVYQYLLNHFLILGANPDRSSELLQVDTSSAFVREMLQVPSPEQQNELEAQARASVAATIVLLTRGDLQHRIYRLATDIHPIKKALLNDQLLVLTRYFKQNEELTETVLQIPSTVASDIVANYWLLSLARLFSRSQPLLFIDNCDALKSISLQKALYLYAVQLGSKISELGSLGTHPLKIVLAIRSESLRNTASAAARTNKPQVITLAQPPAGTQLSDATNHLPLSPDTLERIVSKRFAFFQRQALKTLTDAESPLYITRLGEIVQALSSATFNTDSYYRYIADLSNESIRISLEIIRHIALKILRDLSKLEGFPHTLKLPIEIFFRYRIVDWLFSTDATGRDLHEFITRERELILRQRHYCCVHRIVLTYLLRKSVASSPYIRYSEIVEDLADIFQFTDSDLKKAVWFLYRAEDSQREFISIQQTTPLFDEESVSSDARIFLNPKGSAFVRNVIISPTYWARLAHPLRTQIPSAPILLRPLEFLSYIDPILDRVERLSRIHISNWKTIVTTCSALRASSRKESFHIYSRLFTVGEGFYLERVAQAHVSLIISYLTTQIANDEGFRRLDETTRRKMFPESFDRSTSRPYLSPTPRFSQIKRFQERFGRNLAAPQEIGQIVRRTERFQALITDFESIKS